MRMGEEGILPRMMLNVLLVEADDSTRQIISALLRKCNYRVAAFSDGLKAWETLKNKSLDIDLILTEMELPSVSGFSFLSLIMDHDICKNIPVIMMSSQDSVSMVFQCMLKGAADFLIKPIRRNELRNLWQHVWRRSAIRMSPQNLTSPENKVEVSAENNAAHCNSTGSVASKQKNKECSQKTSDAQSTCTSPFSEAESAYMENVQDKSQPKSSSNSSNMDTDTTKHKESNKFERESAKHDNEAGEKSAIFASEAARCNTTLKSIGLRLDQSYDCGETENQDEVLRRELSRGDPHINTVFHGSDDEFREPCREAIDLIATFENFPTSSRENCSINGGNTEKFDFDTQLELCSRRDSPGSTCEPAIEDRQTLNHSNASAFSRYSSSMLLQPLFPTPSITSTKLTGVDLNSHEYQKLSENTYTSHQYCGKNENQESIATLVIGQSEQIEPKLQNSQHVFFPIAEVTLDHKSKGHGNSFSSMFFTQSSVHPMMTPEQVYLKENSPFPTSTSPRSNSESHNIECHNSLDRATNTSDQNVNDQSKLDCTMNDSPTASQSAGTGFNHNAANHNSSGAYGSSIGSGSDRNDTSSAVIVKNNPQSFDDSCHHSYDGFKEIDYHRTSQREAALAKFRLKRKDRCFDKKVRYQSRKRLAEQRPRVKGQFVRQVNNENQIAESCGGT
ncbi:PREDICTED: two-component response regulator-like PRR95 isoform X1 [Lupinus angustifolius]|nr:PREDICTED: two-component response regulator-like PRR95 isoform X1 [Lupinus angustifolius]